MKTRTLLWLVLLLGLSPTAWAQLPVSQSFETGEVVNYTSNTFDLRATTVTNAVNQYFTFTTTNPPQNPSDASNYSFGAPAPEHIAIKNAAGTDYVGNFWIAEGVRGVAATTYTRDPGVVTLNSVNASGYTGIQVTVALADPRGPGSFTRSGATTTPGIGAFQRDDKIEVQYSTDGGANYTTIGRFMGNGDGASGFLEQDTNLDGVVTTEISATLNYKMTDYPFNITGSPTSLMVRVVVDQRGSSQELAFDNIRVTGTPTTVQAPTLTDAQSGTIINYTEGDPATLITTTIAATNPAGPTLTGATVTMTGSALSNDDQLTYTPIAGSGITGSYVDATRTLTFTGTSSVANYQTILQSVRYRNTNSATARSGNRAIQFVVSNGASTSSVVIRNVLVRAILSGPAALPYTEDFTDDGEGTRYASNAFVGSSTGFAFTRTNANPYTAGAVTFTNISNGFFWYGVNTTAFNQNPSQVGRLEIQQVNATLYSNLHFQIRLGAESGTGAAWQTSDSFKMYYRTGGSTGTWKLFGSFRGNTTITNGTADMRQDLPEDLANLPALPAGTATLTPALTNFDFALPADANGQQVDFKLELINDDTKAEFAFDYIQVTGIQLPTVTTGTAGSITTTTASISNNSLTANGGANISDYGVVYVQGTGTSTTGNFKAQVGTTSPGSFPANFTANLTGLTAATQYTARAYATNIAGTSYGANVTFTTQTTATSIVRASTTNPTNAASVQFTVTFAASVTGVTPSNFVTVNGGSVTGSSVASVTGSGTTYAVTVNTGSGSGTLGLNLANDTGLSPSVSNVPFAGPAITIDKTAPTVTITSSAGASGNPTSTSPIPVTVTFSEVVTGFVAGDVTVGNGTLSGLSGSGTTYTFVVTPSANGAVTVNVPANVAQDAAGNGNTAAPPFSITYSQPVTAAPVVTSPANGSLLNTATPTYTGTAPATSTVTVYVDGTAIGTTTATAGNWSLTQPTALANSPHSVYATAQLSGQSLSGTSNTNSFTVDNSTLSLTLSATELCANSPLSLTATVINTGSPVTYSLSSSPAGFVSSGTSPQVTLTAPAVGSTTAFTLTVAATSNAGNASATTVVTVNSLPAASVVASDPLTCTQPSVSLTAQGGTTYQFSGPGLLSQSANTALVNVAGTYSVTVSSSSGCSSTASVSVSQDNSLPEVSIDPGSATLSCANPTVNLVASGNGTYLWSTGALTASISVSVAGAYSVTVTAANGCTATASAPVSQDNTVPAPSLTASALTTVNQPIAVTASGCNGTLNWQVQGGTGLATGSVYTVTQPGNYTLSATCTVGSCTSPVATPLVLSIRPGVFAITAVTMVNCYATNLSRGEYVVQFSPQYSGTNGNPISFGVVNELAPTTAPAPYTLQLFNDNAVLTLVANQSGNGEARFRFNWLASCGTGTSPNRPPVTTGIPSQSLVAGQPYQLTLGDYITDPDGQALTYSATGLPAGLSLAGSVIGGMSSQTGVYGVSITALDPGGLPVSTPFTLTVQATPGPGTGFALTGVNTLGCEPLSAGQRRLRFTPQYSGLSGQPISFGVVNELAATTSPGPYQLDLYTDNPVITLKASQSGSGGEASFSYNWLAACVGTLPANVAPTVGEPIPNQVGAVNQAFSYSIPASTFTDPNGDALVLSASGLPAGLSLTGSVISGTPSTSGVSTVTITVTDPGNQSVSTRFVLTINQVVIPPTQGFAITGVSLLNCQAVSGQQRLIRFSPQYSGLSGQPIRFQVVNELAPTSAGGPYDLRLYLDNPVIVLRASQAGTASEASFSYNWLAACGSASGRRSAEALPAFSVAVLGNPVEGNSAEVAIRGAQGQAVELNVVDPQGKPVTAHRIEQAKAVERVSLPLGTSRGVLLLKVSTASESQTVKLIRP